MSDTMRVILTREVKTHPSWRSTNKFTVGKVYNIIIHLYHNTEQRETDWYFSIADDHGSSHNLGRAFVEDGVFMNIKEYRDNKIKQLIDV